MRILLIPDVHGRPFWNDAIKQHGEECDKIIFLGDYVDPYSDEGITRKEAIKTLEDIIDFKNKNNDKTILLIGNHDAHYALPSFIRSTRYDASHAFKIMELYKTNEKLFQVAYEETINDKKYLFSHAGLTNSWLNRNKDIIGEPTDENLNRLTMSKKGIDALAEISKYRTWFGEETGSILWSDLREKIDIDKSELDNIIPTKDSHVKGYDYQIFGHTMVKKPIITDNWACLDCKQAFII